MSEPPFVPLDCRGFERPLPCAPLDLLAEIEKELPSVTIRSDRHRAEKFRDTDSIRFLKQNRLSWWTPPVTMEDPALDEVYAHRKDLESSSQDHLYECVSGQKTKGTDTEVDGCEVSKLPHVYEDIPESHFELNRNLSSTSATEGGRKTNPFTNDSRQDDPRPPSIQERGDFMSSMFSSTPPKGSASPLVSTPRKSDQDCSLYDLPRSPPSSYSFFSSSQHAFVNPPSESSRPSSTATHDTSMLSISSDFYPWCGTEGPYDLPRGEVTTPTDHYDVPSELKSSSPVPVSQPRPQSASVSPARATSLGNRPLPPIVDLSPVRQSAPAVPFSPTPRRSIPDYSTFPRRAERRFIPQSDDIYEAPPDSGITDQLDMHLFLSDAYDVPCKSPLQSLEEEGTYDVPALGFDRSSVASVDVPPPNYPAPLLPAHLADSSEGSSGSQDVVDLLGLVVPAPPVPKPRNILPKKEDIPPLPPKTQQPEKPKRNLDRKYSLTEQKKDSPTVASLTSWYIAPEMLRNCDIPNMETASSSDVSDETQSSFNFSSFKISSPGNKFVVKTKSPQRSGSHRITSTFKTFSNRLVRKSSAATLVATSETSTSDSLSAGSREGREDGVWLYVAVENKKEYIRSWSVITDNTLKFYERDSDISPSAWFTCNEVTLVLARRDLCPSTKQSPSLYLLDIRTINGNSRSLGFVNEVARSDYFRHINLSLNPLATGLQGDVWASGLLHFKDAASGQWTQTKGVLHGFRFTTCSEDVLTIDLRKVMAVERTIHREGLGSPPGLQDDNPCFHMVLPNRTLYFQASYGTDTNCWFELLTNAHSVYLKRSLLSEQYLNGDNVPVAMEKCVNFVSGQGSSTTGVYRLAGSHLKIEKLVDSLKKDAWQVHLVPEEYSAHDVANALKRFLRSFPDCLLTQRLYEQWVHCSKITSEEDKKHRMKDLLNELPEVHYSSLKYLCGHLKSISDNSEQNCMTITNLAAIFGPSVFYKRPVTCYMDKDSPPQTQRASLESMAETNAGMAIFNSLVTNYCWLFGISEAVLEKERQIQKAMQDLREARVAQKPAGDILVGVYVYNREWGRCINVKLTPTMTSGQLVKYVRTQLKLTDAASSLSVFEVICSQQLERPLHHSEPVLSVVLSWTGWDEAFSKENFLLVKKNFVYEEVINYLALNKPLNHSGEMHFADFSNRNFKKTLMEFARSSIQMLKKGKGATGVVKEWQMEDVNWYLGCESLRKPPSRFSFSFIKHDEQVKKSRERPFLCHCVSLPSQGDLTSWFASMLCAQHTVLLEPPEEAPDLLLL